MQQKSELPEGWAWTKLEALTDLFSGKAFKKNEYSESGIKLLQIANVSFGHALWDNVSYMPFSYLEKYPELVLNSGDILMALNRPILNGKLKIAQLKQDDVPSILYQRVGRFDLYETRMKAYFFYYAQSQSFIEYLTSSLQGVDQPFINKPKLLQIPFPLPPLAEQRRIVSAIEALFARLDATNEKLDRVPEILKKFRQSVLAAAFNGRLSENWRKANPSVESISSTISYVKSSENNLKNHANYKVKKIDESKLPSLTSKWEWHSIISVSSRVTVGHVGPMKDEYVEEGIPFLRSQNVRENRYDPSGLKHISLEFHSKIKKSALEPNDLVVVRSGNVGVSCVIPEYLKDANCSDLVVVKQPFGFVSEYGSYYLNSIAKSTIELNKVGIALSHFNTQSVANLPIPLPPLLEQQEIVRRIDALFTFADSIEKKVAAARERTEKLRQSILAKAFSGELVPTEAEIARRECRDYETAEVLLERIKKERGKSGKKQ